MRTKPGNKIGTSKVQEAASEPATDGQTAAIHNRFALIQGPAFFSLRRRASFIGWL